MKAVYLIPQGARVTVCQDGHSRLHTTHKPLQFDSPVEWTDDEVTFVSDAGRVTVARALVIVSQYDGMRGVNQFGA
jgi:hypothetical protein